MITPRPATQGGHPETQAHVEKYGDPKGSRARTGGTAAASKGMRKSWPLPVPSPSCRSPLWSAAQPPPRKPRTPRSPPTSRKPQFRCPPPARRSRCSSPRRPRPRPVRLPPRSPSSAGPRWPAHRSATGTHRSWPGLTDGCWSSAASSRAARGEARPAPHLIRRPGSGGASPMPRPAAASPLTAPQPSGPAATWPWPAARRSLPRESGARPAL